MAVFSRLVPVAASAYSLQALCALIFVPKQNEKPYDICGALGWMTTVCISLYSPYLKARFWEGQPVALPNISSFAPRQLLLTAAVGIWSLRLGTFLAERVIRTGGDTRFSVVKRDPVKFSAYWMAQATWIMLVGLPVYLCNAVPARVHPALGVRDFAAFGLFAGSFILEIVADRQKSTWRRAKNLKQHDEEFISSGLWGISRHPNYVGEVGIWTGIWALSTASLQTAAYPTGAVALAAASPLFTWFLLRNVSGVPPLERAGDKKYSNNEKWHEYKRTVPVFWPWGPKN